MTVKDYLDKLSRNQLVSILVIRNVPQFLTVNLDTDEDYRKCVLDNCSAYLKDIIKSVRKITIRKLFRN